MTNMSYCRFRNTLNDLRDCEDYFDTPIYDPLEKDQEYLSADEFQAKEQLIELCRRIAENHPEDEEVD